MDVEVPAAGHRVMTTVNRAGSSVSTFGEPSGRAYPGHRMHLDGDLPGPGRSGDRTSVREAPPADRTRRVDLRRPGGSTT